MLVQKETDTSWSAWNRPNMRIACLVAGPQPPLHRWETWRPIVAPMTALVDLLPRRTSIPSFQLPGAADRVLEAVAAPLPDGRRLVFDRGWNEKRLFGVIAQNPLDYTGSQAVMAWAEAHPRAHVPSFAERT